MAGRRQRAVGAGRGPARVVLVALSALFGCAGNPRPGAPDAPISARPHIAVTAHPMATEAALSLLRAGGSAMDAAIAAQMMLGLVEPQASGPGGGSFVLWWDPKAQRLTSLDGLAAAPARTTVSLRTDTDGSLLPAEPSQRGGRTVGVPGTVAALGEAHRRAGRLPWQRLLQPALDAADAGFPMPRYLHSALSSRDAMAAMARLMPAYFGPDGRPLPVGSWLRNAEYARTMHRLAAGPQAFWSQGADERLVQAAQDGFRPSLLTAGDLHAYRVVEREPVCGPFHGFRVCSMAPPSFGGIAVLQQLAMLQARARGDLDLDDPLVAHLYAEAGKLALADRRQHLADPAFTAVPTAGLLEPAYLRERAQSIDAQRARASPAPAGRPPGSVVGLTADDGESFAQTTQIVTADRWGQVVSVTSTHNLNFGARLMVDGFVLNNAMTNFASAPAAGQTVANQMAPGKRPITSMAPTIVFDGQGRPVAAGGSAGGAAIVDYVARALVEMLARGKTPAQAISRGHQSLSAAGAVQLEAGRPVAGLAAALRSRGHEVEVVPLLSGAAFIRRGVDGWDGAADPRRDGWAGP